MHECISDTNLEELYDAFAYSIMKKDPKLYDDLVEKWKPGGGCTTPNQDRDVLLWMDVPLVLFKNRGSPELVIHWDCKASVTILEGLCY
eukprot:TRINITY_DN3935_c0_g1_i1.p2 TRINITY_DN3935_c0_g1~~TRINITY_DN3935_c0_g1_i1.p2  ORF type:complete len:89 (+),score=7.91 TRINITY_DN3935_c0_g1_i1:184-450(+)